MRFDEGHENPDVIDRRGVRGIRRFAGILRMGPVGVVIGLLVLGVGYLAARGGDDADEEVGITETTSASLQEEKQRHFAAFVLDDAQQTWRGLFTRAGKHYENAELVLYRNETSAACGYGQAATGPFYCPSDDHVYIDLAFNTELADRFGAKGDFAQAYVLAHEMGHHVQKLLGATAMIKAFRRNQREGEEGANVRLELQADCYAGIWAHSTENRGLLDAGDIDAALTAAAAVGDDRLHHSATGHVSPESFRHGTSEQRSRWFKAGFQNGAVDACDTFAASGL